MAQIDVSKMEKITKEKILIHKEATASYSTFHLNDTKFFQIDTYGSSNRKIKNKISQTIQLDEKNAQLLLELLKAEFNL